MVTRWPSLKPQAAEIIRVEQDDVAAFDAAVDVVVFVDNRVKLAFTADRHDADFIGFGAGEVGQIVHV